MLCRFWESPHTQDAVYPITRNHQRNCGDNNWNNAQRTSENENPFILARLVEGKTLLFYPPRAVLYVKNNFSFPSSLIFLFNVPKCASWSHHHHHHRLREEKHTIYVFSSFIYFSLTFTFHPPKKKRATDNIWTANALNPLSKWFLPSSLLLASAFFFSLFSSKCLRTEKS